jgi:pectate lyase
VKDIPFPQGRNCLSTLLVLFSILFSQNLPAFPGAEGYGADASGGRGGEIIHVTNLNASGPGSLQAACEARGARTIVFDTSGIIEGNVIIYNGDLTIAGETAPKGGITIQGQLFSRYEYGIDNIIIRFLRVRPTDLSGQQGDAVQLSRNKLIILDHISVSWGSDETIDMYEADSVTLQWSTIEASATYAAHPDGNFHNYGMIVGPEGGTVSIHHNLWAHHKHRTPAVANGPSDIINNVVYNCVTGFCHHNPASGGYNIIGNYYKTGPTEHDINPFFFDDEDGSAESYYLHDNYIDDPGDFEGILEDPWNEYYDGIAYDYLDDKIKASTQLPTPDITTSGSQTAYSEVLEKAGCLPKDTVSRQTEYEVRNRTGDWGRIIPDDLFYGLRTGSAPQDSDNDGMPDFWEDSVGTNPDVTDNNGDINNNQYTNIEDYLHYCAEMKIRDNTVGISEKAVSPGTTINPVRIHNGSLYYHTPESITPSPITIFNSRGQTVISEIEHIGRNRVKISIKNHYKGVYFLKAADRFYKIQL